MIDSFVTLTYSRIYNEYRDSPKAVEWYLINANIGNQILEAYNSITLSYDIDSNEGAQLDVIGNLIGTDRSIVNSISISSVYFGPVSSQFGRVSSQFSPRSISNDIDLSDEYFKTILRAKVSQNTSDATIDSIILAVEQILPNSTGVRLFDNEDMTFTLVVFGSISDIEKSLLEKGIIPKPQGVKINGILEGDRVTMFGRMSSQFGNTASQPIGLIGA